MADKRVKAEQERDAAQSQAPGAGSEQERDADVGTYGGDDGAGEHAGGALEAPAEPDSPDRKEETQQSAGS